MEEKDTYEAFIRDTVRQLKSGMECYVYKKTHLKEIEKAYKKQTKLDLIIEEKEEYIRIMPKKQYSRYKVY